MATCLRRTDQDLERSAKAAAPARDDLVMHFLLRRSHVGRADLSVTGHLRPPGSGRLGHGSDERIVRQDPGLSNEFASGRPPPALRRGGLDVVTALRRLESQIREKDLPCDGTVRLVGSPREEKTMGTAHPSTAGPTRTPGRPT